MIPVRTENDRNSQIHSTGRMQSLIMLTQPYIQWAERTTSPGIKSPKGEGDLSPPSSPEINNAWSYTSTPPPVFMEWCLSKNMDGFKFTSLYSVQLIHLR
jgi:hypothetical protein